MKVYIYSNGDESVGIFPMESVVELPFEPNDKQDREEIRKLLHTCFHELHDNGTTRVILMIILRVHQV